MQPLLKGSIAYLTYFGTRSLGNQIQALHGDILAHPIVQMLTLVSIMYQATDGQAGYALLLAMAVVLISAVLLLTNTGHPYVDTTMFTSQKPPIKASKPVAPNVL